MTSTCGRARGAFAPSADSAPQGLSLRRDLGAAYAFHLPVGKSEPPHDCSYSMPVAATVALASSPFISDSSIRESGSLVASAGFDARLQSQRATNSASSANQIKTPQSHVGISNLEQIRMPAQGRAMLLVDTRRYAASRSFTGAAMWSLTKRVICLFCI